MTTERTRIRLLGGPRDGTEFESPGRIPQTIRMPVQESVSLATDWERSSAPPMPLTACYAYNGSIRDDGTRIFEYRGQS